MNSDGLAVSVDVSVHLFCIYAAALVVCINLEACGAIDFAVENELETRNIWNKILVTPAGY